MEEPHGIFFDAIIMNLLNEGWVPAEHYLQVDCYFVDLVLQCRLSLTKECGMRRHCPGSSHSKPY